MRIELSNGLEISTEIVRLLPCFLWFLRGSLFFNSATFFFLVYNVPRKGRFLNTTFINILLVLLSNYVFLVSALFGKLEKIS